MSNDPSQQNSQQRYMPSIFPECDSLKQAYDNCFVGFFQHFVKPDFKHSQAENPCQELLRSYQDCIDKNLKIHKPYDIDIEELRKEIKKNFKEGFSQ